MAQLMRFYPGLTREAFWTMPMGELDELVTHMNQVNQQAQKAQQARKARPKR